MTEQEQFNKIVGKVDHELHNLTELKSLMKRSMRSTHFTRKELLTLYSRFKAMSKLSELENPKQPLVGVDFNTFYRSVPEVNQLHAQLLEKLLLDCDYRKQGILDWNSFLQAMTVLRPKSLASRIDACFNLILQKQREGDDGRASSFTSFEEVRKMCFLGLNQTRTVGSGQQPLRDDYDPFKNITDYESWALSPGEFTSTEACIADIYARDFMKKMGYSLKQDIPLADFREKLLKEKSSAQESFTLI